MIVAKIIGRLFAMPFVFLLIIFKAVYDMVEWVILRLILLEDIEEGFGLPTMQNPPPPPIKNTIPFVPKEHRFNLNDNLK